MNDCFEVMVKDLPIHSKTIVSVTCDYCGDQIDISYNNYNRQMARGNIHKFACNKCIGKKSSENQREINKFDNYQKYIDKCNKMSFTPLSTVEDCETMHNQIQYRCQKHGAVTQTLIDFLESKYGCYDCYKESSSEQFRLSREEVIKRVESKNNNTLLNPDDYINHSCSNLHILCGMCGDPFYTSLAAIENGDGACPNCAIIKSSLNSRLSKDQVERRINSVNGNTLLNPDDYITNSVINLNILCLCGNEFTTSLSNYETSGTNRCQSCSRFQSKGEKLIEDILNKYMIPHVFQKRFPDCVDKRPLPFDFYLNELNCIIEFDGPQHFKPIWGEENFKRTQLHDSIKNKYCAENNIKLIRIPYWESQNAEQIIVKEFGLNYYKLISYPIKK